MFMAAAALAQTGPADPAAALRQSAEKATAEWERLATGLDAKTARMLPCDPRVRTAIAEVSRASDTRLAALAQYLREAAAQAKSGADLASQALAADQVLPADIETERAEAQQERAAIDGQLADLAESVNRRETLSDAQKKLTEIRTRVEQRIARAQKESARRAALDASLRNLAAAYQARQKAAEAELSALLIETARFADFYATRMAQAGTECSITNPAGVPQRKKK